MAPGDKRMSYDEDYRESFGLREAADKKKANAALEKALDIRKFEIGLYWQRAAYFWALIAVAFGGYFAILSANNENLKEKDYLAYIVSCIGLLFTWAWFLVNRGSKYWQENWENHVDLLEDPITGPLYKTRLERPKIDVGFIPPMPFGKGGTKTTLEWLDRSAEKLFIGPLPVSVSRVNRG